MTNYYDRVQAYLADRVFSDAVRETADRALLNLRAIHPTPPAPHTGVTINGGVIMSWGGAHDHLELEIEPDGAGSWFWIDLRTDAMWDEPDSGAIPERALAFLRAMETQP